MAVGDGAAFSFDSDPRVLAVCQLEGSDNMYYYSTTFSGGPEVCHSLPSVDFVLIFPVAFLTPPRLNALLTEGRRIV